jgi:glycosyltransferase involved in cell wall biosynthesis
VGAFPNVVANQVGRDGAGRAGRRNEHSLNKIDVLVDLKPALDGYAGIPQETRLLFAALRKLGPANVEGLIQHGGRRLRSGLTKSSAQWPESRRIFQLSKFIVSLSDRPYDGVWSAWADNVDRYFALIGLQWQTALGRAVPCSSFDSGLFADFVWRTFFDKTLNSSEMAGIAGARFRIARSSRNHFHKVGLRSLGLRGVAKYPLLDTAGFDYFIAQTPFPGRVSAGTQLVVRYHDAVPVLMPHTVSDKAFHQATHFHALRSNIQSGAVFSCISEATRKDLVTLFPEAEPQTLVIHDMVSEEYFQEESARSLTPRIVRNRLTETPDIKVNSAKAGTDLPDFPYLLMVSTIEPRKNHLALVSAWEKLKYNDHPDLKLIIVGAVGWDHGAALRAFKPWIEQQELFWLQNVPSAELRVLYRHAAATICPSLAEGFDYSGIEAMRCGCPVVASDIPVHREIFDGGAVYFNPYSVDDAATRIASIISQDSGAMREGMVQEGLQVASRYLPSRILPKWEQCLTVRHGRETAAAAGLMERTS